MSRCLDRVAKQTPLVPAMVMVAMVLVSITELSDPGPLLFFSVAIFVVATVQLGYILSKRSQR